MSDPNVLSVPQAARLVGTDRGTFAAWLREDPEFRSAVVVNVPGKRIRVSRPRLLRRLHGDALREVSS